MLLTILGAHFHGDRYRPPYYASEHGLFCLTESLSGVAFDIILQYAGSGIRTRVARKNDGDKQKLAEHRHQVALIEGEQWTEWRI